MAAAARSRRLRHSDRAKSATAHTIQINEYSSLNRLRRTSSMMVTSSAALTTIETSWTTSVMRLAVYQLPEWHNHQRQRGARNCEERARTRERRSSRRPRAHPDRNLGDFEAVAVQEQ